LQALAIEEKNDILSNALRYFKTHKYLSPKQAFVVFWRLNKHQIEHNPSFFKIDLKHDRFKAQLKDMDTSRVRILWPALTSAQRVIAMRFGHAPHRHSHEEWQPLLERSSPFFGRDRTPCLQLPHSFP
jgi:hypothetical protein